MDPRYFRPAEVDHLEGDPAKAWRIGWEPKICQNAGRHDVDSDLCLAKELLLKNAGHQTDRAMPLIIIA